MFPEQVATYMFNANDRREYKSKFLVLLLFGTISNQPGLKPGDLQAGNGSPSNGSSVEEKEIDDILILIQIVFLIIRLEPTETSVHTLAQSKCYKRE